MSATVNPKKFAYLKPLYCVFRHTIVPLVAPRFLGFDSKYYKIKNEPFLLYSNHCSSADPGFQAGYINKYIRFVASDHLLEKPIVRILFAAIAKPIVNHKQESSDVMVDEIIATIKAGINVAVSIEGRTTNIGRTGYISKRNATLAKQCECDLITYRFTGGYLKKPRWASEERTGRLKGEIVHIYSKEEVAKMTEEELFQHIQEDLYVNIYDEQRKNPQEYTCEHPAEHAEICLYGCPKCHSIGHLHSKDDTLTCSQCGFEAKVDKYGFWHSDDMDFDDIPSWDDMQKELVRKLCEETKGKDVLLFEDNFEAIQEIVGNDYHTLAEQGSVKLYGDRIEVHTDNEVFTAKIDEIDNCDYSGRTTLVLVAKGRFFHTKCTTDFRSPIKYKVAVRYLQGKENY